MATNVLQHAKIDPEFSLAYNLHTAMTRHGKSPWRQMWEICKLRYGPGRLRLDEYYYYGLYDDRRFGFAEKVRFLGRKLQDQIIRQCNAGEWWFVADDKLVCYGLLAGLGLPVPETRAVYHAAGRFAAAPVFAAPEALAAHLRAGMRYPSFGKPVTGVRSVGVAAVERYDVGSDALVLMGGKSLAVHRFVQELEPYHAGGYLFQEMLRPHPELAALCGPRLSTVRLLVLLEHGEPALFRALWKIPVGDHPADNFWRPGNLLAGLNAASGRVVRVVQGAGADQAELERHPDTEQPLIGAVVPDWPALTALCLKAAQAFPGLGIQAWDVAPTERGPVLLEVNIGGDFNLPQLAHGSGLMDQRFRAFVDSCARGSAR
jgi:Sugar-transfer associated ATP-grasp